MSMSRTVVVSATRVQGSQPFSILTDVETWGELKNKILVQKNLDCDGLKAIIQQNDEELRDDNDDLPEGNFTLLLFPVKAKAGK